VAKATRPGRRTELAPISEIKKVAEPVGQKNVAGTQVNPATEDTLAALRDKLINVYAQLLAADLTVAQSITLDADGRTILEIHAASSAATDYTLEASADNTNFFTLATWAAVTAIDETWTVGWRYIKLSSAAAGAAGDTVTLILSAGR
jgi:hypothetical protein